MTIRTDISKRLLDGRKLARIKYKAEDEKKLGVLRAGNSGIMNEEGEAAGSCPRVAHLRQMGIELDPPDDPTLIMFQVGTANEDLVYDDLVHTAGVNETILREEEIPTEWMTQNGTRVTGRPDMVICRRDVDEKHGVTVVPVLGLELKSVASVWTSRSVLFEGEPKLGHLAQAAHYMWQLGKIPFRLVYKQYAIQAMPDFARRYFPQKGRPGSEYMEYNDKGEAKSVRPFEVVYELEFTPTGQLRYHLEGADHLDWVDTIVSWQDVERYYEFVSQMGPTGQLGPVPITTGPTGDSKRWSNCSYCPLNSVCNKRGAKLQYAEWMAEARRLVEAVLDKTPVVE